MKIDYTLVLKGHIHGPPSTRKAVHNSMSAEKLWEHGLTYWHGTGHGMGTS